VSTFLRLFFSGLATGLMIASSGPGNAQTSQSFSAFVQQLPSATLPLTGNERIPVLQGGLSKSALMSSWGGITQLTGDVTTPASSIGSTVATLPNIVAPGTFTKITFNAKGQITGGTAILCGDLANAGSGCSSPAGITELTGDLIAGPGSGTTAGHLATVNSNVGSFVNANITVNAKGLITAASTGLTPRTANPTNFYVATLGAGGSDSADCLSATVSGGHGPCLTAQRAVDLIAANYDAKGTGYIVNYGAGSFNQTVVIGGNFGPATNTGGVQVIFKGAGSGLTNIAVSGGGCGSYGSPFMASAWASIALGSMTVSTSCAGGSIMFIQNHAVGSLYDNDVVFGAATAQHIHVEGFGLWEKPGNISYTIGGAATNHIAASQQAYVEFDPGAVVLTINSTYNFPDGFISAVDNSTIGFGTPNVIWNWSGVTGPKYVVSGNAVITVQGLTGATAYTFLPGNAIGRHEGGGLFYPEPKPTLANATGLGTSPTIAMSGASNNRSGVIVLTTGTGVPAAAGAVDFTFTENSISTVDGTAEVQCALSLYGAVWPDTATVRTQVTTTSPQAMTIRWATNGAILSTSTPYSISYNCR
jgi:hypothetical protein